MSDQAIYERFSAAELLAIAEALNLDVRTLYEVRLPPRAEPRIHKHVRDLMNEHRWTGSEVARRVGLKQPALHRRLSGQVEFSAAELLAIAEVLGRDVRELYGLPAEARSTATSSDATAVLTPAPAP